LKKIPIGDREGNEMRDLVGSREKRDFSRRLKALPKGRQRKAK